MLGVDTNVLVRFLVRDDEAQFEKARKLIKREVAAGLRLVENREADEKARLKALREAARTGIADIEAGRFRGFESAASLARHLALIADSAISGKASASRTK